MIKPDVDSSSATKARPASNKTKTSVFSRIAIAAKRATGPSTGRRSVSDGVAAVFVEYGKLPVALGSPDQHQQDQNNQHTPDCLKARTRIASESALSSSKDKVSTPSSKVAVSAPKVTTSPAPKVSQFHVDIFTKNVPKPRPQITWPNVGERIKTTPQLALCATLLPKKSTIEAEFGEDANVLEGGSDEKVLDGAAADWEKALKEPIKQDLIQELANGIIEEYSKDVTKTSDIIAEAVLLAPVLNYEYYRILLDHTIRKFEISPLLDLISLQGLVQVVQSASPDFLEADDLRKILGFVRTRLLGTLQQSTDYVYHLTLAVSRILDVMADNKVSGLDRVTEHESLSDVLSGLKDSSDPFLLYQASYAYQALQYVPNNETTSQGLLRHTNGVIESAIKISAVLKLDVGEFFNGLKSLTDVAVTVYEGAKSGYEAVCSLIESGQGMFDSLKEGLGAGHRRQWYLAVRQADVFMRGGRVAELNRLIGEAPCRRDPFFQWGICQLLGELAADSDWDVETRKLAVDFLVALHTDDGEWGKDESVRSWTVTLLERLSKLPIDEAVKYHALALLKTLSKDVAVGAAFRRPYPLRSRLPMPESSKLLTRFVRNHLNVKFDLDHVRDQVLRQTGEAVYIPPQAKANLMASDNDTFPLMASVKDFLASERKVMLVLGDSGSGKSLFSRYLERDLWSNYSEYHFLDKKDPIPLYINLTTIDNPERDLITKQLRLYHFSESKIQELKESRRFILICDGYDETKSTSNLYVKNQLNETAEHWQAKMVISCRSTKLGHEYKSQFMPLPSSTHWGQTANLFQEAVIAPFTPDQIKGYIDQYVLIEHFNQPQWKAQEYNDMLNWIPSLKDMVRNPFLLHLALEAMPRLVSAGRAKIDLLKIKVNRIMLYDAVMEEWIIRAEKRLVKSSLSEAEAEELFYLQDNFNLKVTEFLKGLATDIFKEQNGSPQVLFSGESDAKWKVKYFGRKPETTLLRRSSPLVRNGIQNSFIHLSVLDYYFARAIYDPEQSSDLSLASHPLSQRSILGDSSILQFLAERVQQESDKEFPLKRQLLAVIEKSKSDENAGQAAANAITILVKAGVRFNGFDLRGVRIPGADLSGGQFDSTQFQGADLRNVKLRKTWIRQADFSNADMTGVRFGELPHVDLNSRAFSCAYSPNGEAFAVGLHDGSIEIYDTSTWTRIRSFSDPVFVSDADYRDRGDVIHVAFSPKGEFLVSGSERNVFGVWNYHTGELCRTLEGHPEGIASVAVSPDGRQIASAGQDKTVRLWGLHSGEQEVVLTGHTDPVMTVAYSPDGRQLVSGDHGGVIRLWGVQTREAGLVLSREPLGWVHSVAYSSDGRRIVSGHVEGQIQLWNAQTGEPGHLLIGHAKSVMEVTFSTNNQWIASAGADNTVRLWDTETGALSNTLTGHSLNVECVRFSPTSPQFASTGLDRTVRIWELQDLFTSASGPNMGVQNLTEPLPFVAYSPSGQNVMSGNREGAVYEWDALSADPRLLQCSGDQKVACMAYSPDGLQIALASKSPDDYSVQLLDLATGELGLSLSGHEDTVRSLFYSPCSRWIATASDDETVGMWDTQAASTLLVHTFKNHASGVAFSPDGGRIAFGGYNKKLWVHDASTGKLLATLKGHSEPISGVVYSPNGLLIGSSSWDNTARLWDTTTNKIAVILRGHSNWVQCLAFSTCGKWIATGSRDWTVRLWNVQSSLLSASDQNVESSGVCVSVVQPFFAFVTHLAWNPNGASEFVSASHEHYIRAWKVVVIEDKSKDKDDGQDTAAAVSVSVRLDWSSESNSLVGIGTKTAEAKGLNDFDRALLKQRESAKENKQIGEYELVV